MAEKIFRAELTYTPALVRRAASAFVRRGLGGGWAVLSILVLIGAAIWSLILGSDRWLNGVFCGVTAMLLVLVIGIYFLHYRRGLAKLRRMRVPHATIDLTEAEFRVTADSGIFATSWTTFSRVWRFRDFWLLVIGTNQYITLPTANLSEEIKAFIASRVAAAGGRVT